jgi:hypothetical protein
MRALGITSIEVKCECGREAIVDAFGWPNSIEIPSLRWRLKCKECGGRPIDVRPKLDAIPRGWERARVSQLGRALRPVLAPPVLLCHVAEFEFRYNHRHNPAIFEAAIAGC